MGLNMRYGFVAIFALVGLAFSGPAWAGGLALYELGTPDVGTAAAGWSARAQDASTAFTNPAGMTRLEKSQMLAGAQPLYVNAKFDTDSSTFGDGDGGNAGGWVPAGGLFYVHEHFAKVEKNRFQVPPLPLSYYLTESSRRQYC